MMPHRHSISNRWVATIVSSSLAILPMGSAHAGAATGNATEFTQLANNSELVDLMKSSGVQVDNQLTQISQLAEQIENQLKIYENMVQNTAQLPSHVWGEIAADLSQLRSIVNQGQGIAFSMGNADDLLKQRFSSYSALQSSLPTPEDFSAQYQSWSDTTRDTIAGTLKAASLTSDQFDTEEDTMNALRSMSETADGQMKALQVGHEIAAQQVAQMQKLRGLVSQQMTMLGTWLQAQQTGKDLAEARREKFFDAEIQTIPSGQQMEPRW